MNAGKALLQDCVRRTLAQPIQEFGPKIRAYATAMSVFDPGLDVGDIVNGFRNGEFKDLDFIDQDISLLSNIEFSRINSMSSSFASRIVDQLELDPPAVATIPPTKAPSTSSAILRAAPGSISSCAGTAPCPRHRPAVEKAFTSPSSASFSIRGSERKGDRGRMGRAHRGVHARLRGHAKPINRQGWNH